MVWTKLQEVLSSVEDSISVKRSWAAPITASDQVTHREHLRAAQESRVKAAQVASYTVCHLLFVGAGTLNQSGDCIGRRYWTTWRESLGFRAPRHH